MSSFGSALAVTNDSSIPLTSPRSLRILSHLLGWIYTAAWSLSFYPQLVLNFRRKSTAGLSLDFVYLNLVGFMCYAAYTGGLLWNPVVRDEYARRQRESSGGAGGSEVPLVQVNDFVFATHAALVTLLTLIQTVIYKGSATRSWPKFAVAFIAIVALAFAVLAGLAAGNRLAWLDVLYYLSSVKIVISLSKYVPQLILNYRRQSTVGWSIIQILLDFTGGALSITQELLDAYIAKDWAGLAGNWPKMVLGAVSMLFDIAFMFQHFVLYSGRDAPDGEAAEESIARGWGEETLVGTAGSDLRK